MHDPGKMSYSVPLPPPMRFRNAWGLGQNVLSTPVEAEWPNGVTLAFGIFVVLTPTPG